MTRNLAGFLVFILAISIRHAASIFHPISDSHRYSALELFKHVDGSFGSLEETYETLRTFEILGIKADISEATCGYVSETFGSSSSNPKDLFYALGVDGVLKCNVNEEVFEGIISRLQAAVNDANSLLDFYYSLGSLRFIKALSQSDGRWSYGSNNPESSTFAAGIALKALAGVVSLASSEIDQSMMMGSFTLMRSLLACVNSMVLLQHPRQLLEG